MNEYKKQINIRWSDLDPNFHARHSVYYDWGAWMRMSFLAENGLTPLVLIEQKFGPIIFREEALFRKEIHFGEDLSINLKLKKCNANYSRWAMQHEIIKNENTVAAIITVEGAWMDTEKRKLMIPPAGAVALFEHMPRTTDFEWIEK